MLLFRFAVIPLVPSPLGSGKRGLVGGNSISYPGSHPGAHLASIIGAGPRYRFPGLITKQHLTLPIVKRLEPEAVGEIENRDSGIIHELFSEEGSIYSAAQRG